MVEITFEVADACGQSEACTSIFTVLAVPVLTVSCPAETEIEACTDQTEVDAAFENWLGQFTYNGGCDTEANDLGIYTAPDFCGGMVEITFEAADACGQSEACTSTFTVIAAPELTVSCPGDVSIVPCRTQEEVDLAFETWINAFYIEGGCEATATDLSSLTPPDAFGGIVSVAFEASDNCGQSASCSSTFTVQEPPVIDISCPDDFAVCCDAEPVNLMYLEGLYPLGGEFTGQGVSVEGQDYYFNPECASLGGFEILYTYTEPDFGCQYSCSFSILVSPFTEAYAGESDSIFNDQTFVLSQATASNAVSLLWNTNGDGSFDEPTDLNPVYLPGQNDIAFGYVELCLTAYANEGCDDVVSCLGLTLLKTIPEVSTNPSCMQLTLLPDQTFDRSIIIDNAGFVDLEYEISEGADWLMPLDPLIGIVPSRSAKPISFMFDASGLGLGDYYTDIVINTNDPESLQIVIPVTLHIVDAINGQAIHIPYGWSYLSSYILPEEPQLEDVFEGQIDCSTLYFMLNSEGVFWPSQSVNTIGDWNPYLGYKVKMSVDDQVIMLGEEVDEKTLQLPVGTYILPVLSSCEVPAEEFLSQIEGQFAFVFDLEDQLLYWPEGGIYTLQNLVPGRGYLISMLQQSSITFEECNKFKTWVEPVNIQKQQGLYSVTKTSSYHIISVDADVLADFRVGDYIAAFNDENLCVGYSKISSLQENLGLVIFGDDFSTTEIDGMIENEHIWLKIIDQDTKGETDIDYEFDQTLPDNLPVYRELGLSRIIKFHNISNVLMPANESFNIHVYPNPTTGEFILLLDNEKFTTCKLEVYRIDGQLVMSEGIEQTKTSFNINDMPSGIYILNVNIDGQIVKKRLIKQ